MIGTGIVATEKLKFFWFCEERENWVSLFLNCDNLFDFFWVGIEDIRV